MVSKTLFFCISWTILGYADAVPEIFAVSGANILKVVGTAQTPVIQRSGQVIGLAADIDRNYLFWSEIVDSTNTAKIYRSGLDGSNVRAIVEKDLGEVLGLAVDWVSSHLYWTDARHRMIEVSEYDGSNRYVIAAAGLESPRGIVVNPIDRYLYWGDQGTHAIHRSYLDGTGEEVFIKSDSSTYWPNQLAISFQDSKLYWADGWSGSLMSCYLNSGVNCNSHGNISGITERESVFGITLNNGDAYTGTLSSRVIYKSEGETASVLHSVNGNDDGKLLYMLSKDGNMQPTGEAASCGNCGHMCLWSSSSSHCHCPSYGGYLPTSDTACSQNVDGYLVYADSETGIVGMTSTAFSVPDIFILAKANRPAAVTYDPVEQMIYYSDLGNQAIYRIKPDGTGLTEVLNSTNGIGQVEGMSVDARQGFLYYTNTGYVDSEAMYTWHRIDMISIASLDGSHKPVRTVVTDVTRPRGIYIDQEKRVLHHSDWGTETQIRTSDMDGQNMKTLGGSFQNPNGLFVQDGKLYVVDSNAKTEGTGKLYKIENGQLTELLDSLDTPFGLTGDGSSLYMTDWGKKAVLQYRIENKQLTERHLRIGGRPIGIQYVSYTSATRDDGVCEDKTNRCDKDNGICVLGQSSQYATCLCPTNENKVLLNFRSCQVPENYLLFADQEGIKMVSLDKGSDQAVHLVAPGPEDSNVVALARDPDSTYIYFSDSYSFRIYRANLQGGESEIFVTLKHCVENLVVSEGILYWTTRYGEEWAEENSIYSYRTDRSDTDPVKLLSGLDKPRGIAIDKFREIYWTESGVLKAATLNGESKRTVATLNDYNWVNGLSFDSVNRQIYIGAAQENGKAKVFRCRITEVDSCSLMELPHTEMDHVFSVLVADSFIYVSNWEASTIERLDLLRLEKTTFVENLVRPTQMIMVTPDLTETAEKYGSCPSVVNCVNGRDTVECGNDWGCPDTQKCCHGTTDVCRQCMAPTASCSKDDLEFSIGNIYSPDNCEMCNCTSGGLACTSKDCPDVVPSNCMETAIPPGKCCEECRSFSECTQKPEFHNCPGSSVIETVFLPPDSSTVTVSKETSAEFRDIYATSCSGQKLEVNILHTLSWTPTTQYLNLEVTDVKGLSSSCQIAVLVKDRTDPYFTYCPDKMKIITKEETGISVTWQLPQAKDNAGDPIVQSESRKPGDIFAVGRHTVLYTASDGQGNTAECRVQIEVEKKDIACSDPIPILNGELECSEGSNSGLKCSVGNCYDNYIKNNSIEESYQCEEDGSWLPGFPELFSQQACFKPEKLGLKLVFNIAVKDSSANVAVREVLNCFHIGNLCPEDKWDKYKKEFFLCDPEYLTVTAQNNGKVEVSGTTTTSFDYQEENREEVVADMEEINDNVVKFFENGDFVKYCTDFPGQFDKASKGETPEKFCPAGEFLWEANGVTICVKCSVGTRYNHASKHCDACPLGQYQDAEGQVKCKLCPEGYTTDFLGAYLGHHCTQRAAPGVSETFLTTAVLVGIGVGGFLVLAIIVAVTAFCIYKVRVQSKTQGSPENAYETHQKSVDNPEYADLGMKSHKDDHEVYNEIPADAVGDPTYLDMHCNNPAFDDYLTPH